jgi:hypothetical protein
MIKKLKILSMAALAAVAAVTTTQAATITNVIEDVTVAFTLYPSNSIKANIKDNVLTATVKPASLATKAVLSALEGAIPGANFSSAAKLVLLTQYHVTNVFTIQYTNFTVLGTNITTNLLTFYSDNPVYLESPNFYDVIATNLVFTNVNTTPIFAVDDRGAITLLTNKTPYNPTAPTVQTTLVTNQAGYHPIFGTAPTALYNGSNDSYLTGTIQAVNGDAIFGTSSGTTYGVSVSLTLDAPADWTLTARSDVGAATVVSKNLGTAKAPVYINYVDGTWNVTGSGFMGGTEASFIDTNSNPATTNVWVTNAIPFLFKGTASVTFDSITEQ